MASFGFDTTGSDVVDLFKDRVAGRTFLITGPSPDGIGAEIAFSLARATPGRLILAGRSQVKIQPVVHRLNSEGVHTTFLQLDLGSLKSVRQAVEDLKEQQHVIDVLINNAAIMACPWSLTEDGLESQFATNHLGPFLFTNLLLAVGLIKERIVNVNSSASVRKASYLLPPLKDITYGNGATYDPVQAYGVSKIANLLYTKRLAEKLRVRKISAFSLNPGSIQSPLQRHMTKELGEAMYEAAYQYDPDFVPPKRKTVQQGCATPLRAALDPELPTMTGAYLDDCQVKECWQHAEAYGATDKVWTLSEKLVGQEFDF